jgi:signal transduction histidine kinase/streptogramin lyase
VFFSCLSSSCSYYIFLWGAQENYRAVHWDTEDGLAQSLIGSIIKDANGFLWLSTSDGLSRFDGSTFKNYYGGQKSNKTIFSNDTKKLIEDSLHNIWIGTTNSLSRYDIKADTFTHFFTADNSGDVSILPFAATRNAVLCIEKFARITSYDIHTLKRKILREFVPGDLLQDGMEILYTVFDPASNNVWMLHGEYSKPGGGLYKISLSDGSRKYYEFPCYKNIPNHCHWSEAMCYDRIRNAIWINSPDGLIEFTLSDNQFHQPAAIKALASKKDYDRLVGIDIDKKGRICFAASPVGIIIYDPSNGSVTIPFENDPSLRKEVTAANLCLYCDQDGMIWSSFYTLKGLYQLIPFSQTVKQYMDNALRSTGMSNNIIINCVNAAKGKIWMGTIDGLNIFDPQTNLCRALYQKNLPGIQGNQIIPAGIDTIHQKAWLHTEKGFFEMDIATGKCRPVIFKDSAFQIIQHPGIIGPLWYGGYCQYKNGCIIPFVYPDGETGIFLVNSDSAVAHEILKFPGNISFYGTATGNDKYLFLGTLDDYTFTYACENGKWVRVHNALDSIKRKSIIYSKADSSYWLMDERELYHYDENFRLIHKYTREDGLPLQRMDAIMADDIGNIWFTTDHSISHLNVKAGKITTLSARDGFQNQNFSPGGCIIKATNRDLYFMSGIQGTQGFARVMPGKFRETYPPSATYIKSLEVNQNAMSFTTGINNLTSLSLKYFQNNISIESGIVDYYSKGTNNIRFKLEEINNNWQYAPANYTIRYDGLPPGKYKLVMQASNAAGEFNGLEKSLLIQISPPFWKTWWFIALLVIVGILALNALFRFRIRQKMRTLNVRQRLHRDLHDDVGATLSSVKVYSEILQTDSNNAVIIELIKNNAEEMIDKLGVIAWATNPQNDTFKSFKDLLSKTANTLCHAKNISFNLYCDGVQDSMLMPGDVRQHLFLIFKEALNNMIKYSGASACDVRLFITDRKFNFIMKDNGNGFSDTIKGTGNGLKNMQKRSDELNGKMTIDTITGEGTTITLSLPYPFKIPDLWGKNKSVT